MRLAVLPLALFLVAATPAVAQVVINGSRQASASQRERGVPMANNNRAGADLRQIDRDARQARRNGEITRREERAIHRQAARIASLGSTYAANGLTDAEIAVLETQALALRSVTQAPVRRGH